jgi:predicted dehydrogenase
MMDVAIIGCGAVVEDLHLAPLRRLERTGVIRVRWLVDPSPERQRRLGAHFRHAAAVATPEQAFAARGVALALVASPPGFHLAHALLALRAESHVLIEKPMVVSSLEAQQLLAAAEAGNRQVAVGMPRRFFPNLTEVAGLLAERSLGETLTFSYREGGPYSWPVSSDAAFRRATSGGGVLIDKGVHALDVLDYLFGEGALLSAEDDSLANGVESNMRLRLRYGQTSGTIQLSWDQPLRSGLWIHGEREELFVGFDGISDYQRRVHGGPWKSIRASTSWPTDITTDAREVPFGYHRCIWLEWIDALRACMAGTKPSVGPEAAGRIIGLIEAAYSQSTPLDLTFLPSAERTTLAAHHWRSLP